jgi:hypothetical protein
MGSVHGYCCGFVRGVPGVHQLWCAEHPDRKRGAEPVQVAPPPNKPEPKSAADRLALQCAALLDEDKWDTLNKHEIDVRGVRFWIANGAKHVVVRMTADTEQLREAGPAEYFRELFWESYQAFLRREVERRAAAVERELQRKLNPPPIPEVKPIKRGLFGRRL